MMDKRFWRGRVIIERDQRQVVNTEEMGLNHRNTTGKGTLLEESPEAKVLVLQKGSAARNIVFKHREAGVCCTE